MKSNWKIECILLFFCFVMLSFMGCGSSMHSPKSVKDKLSTMSPSIFVQLGHSGNVNSVAFSPDGKYALSGSGDDTLKLWDIASGREIRTFKGHSGNVNSVAFSPDGNYALSGSTDQKIKLWDISSGKEDRKSVV